MLKEVLNFVSLIDMCLAPVILINPDYLKRSREFSHVQMASDSWTSAGLNLNNGYPYWLSPYKWPVTIDNINDFFAYDDLGETIPIYIQVPCGKCTECIESRRSQMVRRMFCEYASTREIPIFLTLTYDDNHLPADGVCVRDVQLFYKRLRRNIERKFGFNKDVFRHITFSEYGSLRGRPHYHAVLFGFRWYDLFDNFLDFSDFIGEAWQQGFVHAKCLVDYNGFYYASKYMLKDKKVPCGCNRNFYLSSRKGGGIGAPFVGTQEFEQMLQANPQGLNIYLQVLGNVVQFDLPKYVIIKAFPHTPSQLLKPDLRKSLRLISQLSYLYFEKVDKSDIPIENLVVVELAQHIYPQYSLPSNNPFDDLTSFEVCLKECVELFLKDESILHGYYERESINSFRWNQYSSAVLKRIKELPPARDRFITSLRRVSDSYKPSKDLQ